MERQEVDVRIGAQAVPVGRLIVDGDGRRAVSTFLYHQSWLAHPHGFDLAPGMPRQTAPFHRTGGRDRSCLPWPVDDGAPDSWGRRVLEKTSGRTRLGDLEYITGTDDGLRVGALRYFTSADANATPLAPPATPGTSTIPQLHTMDEVVRQARAFEANPDTFLERRADLVGGSVLQQAVGSLGGARPKFNAVDSDGSLWIVKLPKQNDTYAMARAEAMALELARMVGIQAAVAQVVNDSPRFPMIRVRRFDRTGGVGGQRVPYISAQTFMAGLGGDRDDVFTYEDIATRMRAHAADFKAQVQELYRRMAFSVLLRNTDDHLRNHGFLRTAQGWVLSPAFDINPEHRPSGTLQTPISAIHGDACDVDAILDAAPLFDLDTGEAKALLRAMATTIAKGWRAVGARLGMDSHDTRVLAQAMENDGIDRAVRF
jgi:serine/threonine-protein kinase HipA